MERKKQKKKSILELNAGNAHKIENGENTTFQP